MATPPPAPTHQRQRGLGGGAARDWCARAMPSAYADRRPALACVAECSLGPTQPDQRAALLVDLGCQVPPRRQSDRAATAHADCESAACPAASRLRVASSALVASAAT